MLHSSGAERPMIRNHYNYTGIRADILLDDVNCVGDESSLFKCRHNGLGKHNCKIPETAGVVCIQTPIPVSFCDYFFLIETPACYY